MNVIIMRGLPGSGKTTYVKGLQGKLDVCSADDYHMVDGVYKFDAKKSGEAHDKCFKRYLYILLNGVIERTLVVDNTNTTLAEIAPYARVASALGIPFKIVYIYADVVEAFRRNKHGVPFATMLRMQQHLDTEQVPPYWPQEIIIG